MPVWNGSSVNLFDESYTFRTTLILPLFGVWVVSGLAGI